MITRARQIEMKILPVVSAALVVGLVGLLVVIGAFPLIASFMADAVRAGTVRTPGGGATLMPAATSTTSPPLACASSASATPMRPEDRFVITRHGRAEFRRIGASWTPAKRICKPFCDP